MTEPISIPSGAISAPACIAGLSAEMMHEHLWRAAHVQVVRRGAWASINSEARRYLLLSASEFASFDIDRELRASLRRHKTVAVEILNSNDTPYRERLVFDENNGLSAIAREFQNHTTQRARVILTADASEARRWACGMGLPPARETRSAHGRLYAQSDDPGETTIALFHALARQGIVPASMRTIAPGVLAEQSSTVSAAATLTGTVVIGAGHRIGPNASIVGPTVLLDRVRVPAPALTSNSGLAGFRPERPANRRSAAEHFDAVATRLFDILFSVVVLAITLPLFPLVMLLIALEDGRPFFFLHERQGRDGRLFKVIKFRTMRRDAHDLQESLQSANQCDGPQFYNPRDPRALRSGHFLRRWSIDEIPQFINILRGEMSVVGPRPSPDGENRFCPAWRELRLSVKPGLTGLWQINRTREPAIDFQEWVRYDTEYVRTKSISLDIRIVCQTLQAVLRSARRAALSPQASQQLSNDAPQDGGVIARIEQGRIVRPAHDEQAKKAA